MTTDINPVQFGRMIEALENLTAELHDGVNMLKNPDGSCIALVDNRCSIYALRPEVCRASSRVAGCVRRPEKLIKCKMPQTPRKGLFLWARDG